MNDNKKTDGQRMLENGHYREYYNMLEPIDCGTHDEWTPAGVMADWCEERGYCFLANMWRKGYFVERREKE